MIKSALQKKYPVIRGVFIAVCIVGGLFIISIGYSFFQGRVFWIFATYVVLMVGVVLLLGLRVLAVLIS